MCLTALWFRRVAFLGLRWLSFYVDGISIGFDDDVNFRPGFERRGATIFVAQNVFHPNLSIKIVGFAYVDLRFFFVTRAMGLITFCTVPCSFFRVFLPIAFLTLDRGHTLEQCRDGFSIPIIRLCFASKLLLHQQPEGWVCASISRSRATTRLWRL